MRTKTVREWTYEEVRKALSAVYGDVSGIKISQSNGYLAEECPASEQARSPEDEPTVKP